MRGGARLANIVPPFLPVGCEHSNDAIHHHTMQAGCPRWEEGELDMGEPEKGELEDLLWSQGKPQEWDQLRE